MLLYVGLALALLASRTVSCERSANAPRGEHEPESQAQPDLLVYTGVPAVATRCRVRSKPGASPQEEKTPDGDTFPDLGSLTDVELKDVIQQLTDEETEISYKRRILHGKIDILRAELVNRLRKKHDGGEMMITGDDVQQLTDILANRQPEQPA